MKQGSWLVCVGAGCCLPVFWCASAAAEERGAEALQWLEWEAPAGCPEAADVYARTRAAVGYAPELGRFERVRGVIVREENGFRLALEFSEARARRVRSIEAQACSDLEGAAAVAIALALGREAGPSPAAGADRQESDVPASSAPSVPPADSAPLGWSGSVAGLLDLASVSQPSWGVGVSSRVRFDSLELGLSGLWLPDSRHTVGTSESVQFGLAAAGPLACWRWAVPLSPAACAGFEFGRLNADGSGLSRNERHFAAWWMAPSLGLELAQAFAQAWSVELRMEALRPLLREHYTVNGNLAVYDSPEVVLRWSLGLVWSVD
jgi:hypothetical protein